MVLWSHHVRSQQLTFRLLQREKYTSIRLGHIIFVLVKAAGQHPTQVPSGKTSKLGSFKILTYLGSTAAPTWHNWTCMLLPITSSLHLKGIPPKKQKQPNQT